MTSQEDPLDDDPSALVVQAQQEAGRREGEEDLAALLHDLADALSAAIDRIARFRAFIVAYDECDGSRGRFSTAPAHDCRCEKDRMISDACTCGGDALEAARYALEIPNA